MRKVIWLNASLSQGGSERVMTILANAFAENGIDTKMVLLREGKDDVYSVSNQLKLIRFHYQTKNKFSILFKRFKQLRNLIKKEKPDCVISFMWDINAFTLVSCLGLHQKIIVSERGHPMMGHQGLCRKFAQNWLYRLAYRIVFQTEDVAKYYPDSVQKKSVVIPNPINPDLPDPFNEGREKEVVSAGRLTDQKNFSLLLRSFADFYLNHPDWKLTIYGEGPLHEPIEEEARELNIENSILLPGFVNNLPQRIVSSGMYVNSSNFEGISNVMLEAMAIGLPCICTDCPVGGAALAIQNGVNGILIPINDQKALTEAMCRIADDPAFSKEMQTEAVKIRERFSIQEITSSWMRLCNIQQERSE